jgi:hypothetical protein
MNQKYRAIGISKSTAPALTKKVSAPRRSFPVSARIGDFATVEAADAVQASEAVETSLVSSEVGRVIYDLAFWTGPWVTSFAAPKLCATLAMS